MLSAVIVNINFLLFPPYTSKHEKQKTKRHKFSPQIFVYRCFLHQAICGVPVDIYILCFSTVSFKSIDNVLSECMTFFFLLQVSTADQHCIWL